MNRRLAYSYSNSHEKIKVTDTLPFGKEIRFKFRIIVSDEEYSRKNSVIIRVSRLLSYSSEKSDNLTTPFSKPRVNGDKGNSEKWTLSSNLLNILRLKDFLMRHTFSSYILCKMLNILNNTVIRKMFKSNTFNIYVYRIFHVFSLKCTLAVFV